MKLTNSDIVGAKGALGDLLKLKLPVKCSMQVAKLDIKLNEPVDAFAKVRDGLFQKYEIERKNLDDGRIEFTSKKEGNVEKFVEEFNELLNMETELVFEKIKLPEKIAATCDKCNHNMDKPLEIEGTILRALEKFVEIS